MPLLNRCSTFTGVLLCSTAFLQKSTAQTAPPAILEIDVENYVSYVEDTGDVTKFATLPNVTPSVAPKNFYPSVIIGDIVAVNGEPAKGTVTFHLRKIGLTATPNPGDSIADTGRSQFAAIVFELLKSDGTAVGSLMAVGLAGTGAAPPGSPPCQTQGNNAITGGTGAFLGVRGSSGQSVTAQTVAVRSASITEDPANRRRNGGGKVRFVQYVIPLSRPEILSDATGPLIAHADFSPVTAAKPAKAGEVLIVQANGLGPTIPGVALGQPFPVEPLQQVNSPLGVSVTGRTAEVIASAGWPGRVDTYRVDFRVPDGTSAGNAMIQLTAAWIAGSPVSIPVE